MARYNPTQAPSINNRELQTVVRWLEEEFRAISAAVNVPEFEVVRFTINNVALSKVENGDVAYADGTNWNPGAGAGLYEYVSGAWSKL